MNDKLLVAMTTTNIKPLLKLPRALAITRQALYHLATASPAIIWSSSPPPPPPLAPISFLRQCLDGIQVNIVVIVRPMRIRVLPVCIT